MLTAMDSYGIAKGVFIIYCLGGGGREGQSFIEYPLQFLLDPLRLLKRNDPLKRMSNTLAIPVPPPPPKGPPLNNTIKTMNGNYSCL